MPTSTWPDYFEGKKQVETSQKRQNLLQVAEKVVRTRIDDILTIIDGLNNVVKDDKQTEKYLARIFPEKTRAEALILAQNIGRITVKIKNYERTMRKIAYAKVKRDSTDGSLLESSKIYLQKNH